MISSKTVAAASMRLTYSEGSSAIVLAQTAVASTPNLPDLKLIEYIPLREFARFELTD